MAEAAQDRPDVVSTPKSFFTKERDQFYSDWKIAFWRELFQNSIDAGARNIEVTVADLDQRGSFGRVPQAGKVPSVTFADDGCGMSREVLDDVYFSIGRSSKTGGDTVGGFGRARLLTCFAQTRYAVHTLDRVVEGDGGEYKNYSLAEARQAVGRWLAAADAASAQAPETVHAADAVRLRAEYERLAAAPDRLGGCRIEVDLDPGTDTWRRATVDRMLQTLETYLQQSDLKCAVTVNGKAYERPKYKVEGRRDVVATVPDDGIPAAWRTREDGKAKRRPDGAWDVRFGRLALATGDAVPRSLKGEITVRVAGASMFTQSAGGTEAAVLVEVDPSIARDVLNANRDGLKAEYKRALDDLTALLSTDAQMALKKDTLDSYQVLRGGKGAKTGRGKATERADLTASVDKAALAGAPQRALSERIQRAESHVGFSDWQWSSLLEDKLDGLRRDDTLGFLRDLAAKDSVDGTFLSQYRDKAQAEGFLLELRNRGELAALQYASGTLLGFVRDNLALSRMVDEDLQAKRDADKMQGLNDVPILRENVAPPADRFTPEEARVRRGKIVSAIRRHDPRNWDTASGKGMLPRKVLAAWNVAVDHCVDVLFEAYPQTKPFGYSCGWLFNHPQWTYDSLKQADGWRATRAMARIDKSGDAKSVAFLLNPLDERNDFRNRFSPSDPDDRDSLITDAAHEVAHAVVSGHNDAYAYLFTDMVERLTTKRRRAIHQDIDKACRLVDRLYASGRTRVVPLDGAPGTRPAERAAGGSLSDGPGNEAVVRTGRETVLDNDLANERETAMFDAPDPEEAPGWR